MGKKKTAAKSNITDSYMLDPSIIRFTHSKIRPMFSGCGRRVEDTLNDLINDDISVLQLPHIAVLTINGEYYSLNNRRLYVFKELYKQNLISTIPVRYKTATEKEKNRYTPLKCSLTATIMKEHTFLADPCDDNDNSNDNDNEQEAGIDIDMQKETYTLQED